MKNCETSQIYEVIQFKKNTGVRFYTSIDDNTYVPPHWHDAIEIVLIQEGQLLYSIDGTDFIVKAHQCMLVNANVVHSTKCLGPNKAIVFQIPLSFFEMYIHDISSFRFDLYQNEDEESREKFICTLEHMQVLSDKHPSNYLLAFNSKLFEALYLLCDKFSQKVYSFDQKQRKKELSRLSKILDYIKAHYTESISIKKISSVACLQEGYFCRFFKKNMGITFLQYHNEIRLNHIYQDLELTDDPIKDILERHGFDNYKLFRKMFNARFGCTPRELRKNLTNVIEKNK